MSRSASRTLLVLAALFVSALALRLAWAWWTAPVPHPLADEEFFAASALSLTRGQGYHVAFAGGHWRAGGDATAFWPPGFSAYLAIAFRLFGEHLAVARAADAVAGAAIVVPVYYIGRRLFGEAEALAAGVIAALMPSLVFWTPVLLADTLAATLVAATAALFVCALPRAGGPLRITYVLAGALCLAAATFVRGQALLVLPAAAAWWYVEGVGPRRALAHAALVFAIVALALAPWAVRNARVLDSPILLSTNLGYNLRVGHAPYSTGRYIVPQDLWDAQPGIPFQRRELLFDRLGRRRAVGYALHHVRREVALSALKVAWLWRPDSDVFTHVESYGLTPLPPGARTPLLIVFGAAYGIVLALAGIALLRWRERWRALLFPVVLAALWTAAHVVFFGEPRYHLPLLAVIVPMAGASAVWLARGARHSRRSGVPLAR
ncbi:MAG: glycosyltransferase family 39 protein [Chloroflexota bacterium]|nr:glycosyltransferase family 39 protein [Chloroflexota bacterium]